MAITTLTQYKLIKGITGTAQDAQITAMIPLVESDYLNIRNRPFEVGFTVQVTGGATADGDLTFTVDGSDIIISLVSGDSIYIIVQKIGYVLGGVVRGDTVTLITPYTYTFDAGATGVTAILSNVGTLYPDGAERTAIDMLHWQLSGGGQSAGVASESLGKYSISYDTGQSAGGYPKSITGAIRRFVSYK